MAGLICDVQILGGFFSGWAFMTLMAIVLLTSVSGLTFWVYYANPTYEKWIHKSNPKYPPAKDVRLEVIQMFKGMVTATVCPAISIYLAQTGKSKAFCGWEDTEGNYWGPLSQALMFFGTWIAVDFFEFFYHYLGHQVSFLWTHHRFHHKFYNPTPFAVIADEYVDQFVRASPLLWMPLLVPINIDLMFLQFGLFFYAYGTYLHWGHEHPSLRADHPIINTAFQHYCHHAISKRQTTYHCGFFFKIWDQIFGTMYDGTKCKPAYKCAANGERSREQWEKIKPTIPDYSVLLEPKFWFGEKRNAVYFVSGLSLACVMATQL